VINLKTAKALGLIISNQMQFSPTEWSNRPDCCNALRSLMAQSLTSLRRSEWSLLGVKRTSQIPTDGEASPGMSCG